MRDALASQRDERVTPYHLLNNHTVWRVGEERYSYWYTDTDNEKIVKAITRRLTESIRVAKIRNAGQNVMRCNVATECGKNSWSRINLEKTGRDFFFNDREVSEIASGGNDTLSKMMRWTHLKTATEGLAQLVSLMGEEVLDVTRPDDIRYTTGMITTKKWTITVARRRA